MTISELIQRLEALKAEHGDLDVYGEEGEGTIFTPNPESVINIIRSDDLGRIVKPLGRVVLL